MNRSHYTLLADLFEYPSQAYPEKVKKVQAFLDSYDKDASESLTKFMTLLPARNVEAMQELFIRSFDVQSVTTLDIGYVLFGEDYKRGELLVNLSRELKALKIDCRNELADHLPNVLRLIAKLENDELLEEMVVELIAPALIKMIGEFDPNRLEEKNKLYKKHYKTVIDAAPEQATLYRQCLQALYNVLDKDFSVTAKLAEKKPLKQSIDFIKSVTKEIEIEENQ